MGVLLNEPLPLRLKKKKLMLQGKIRLVMELPLHRPFSQVTVVVFLRSNANKSLGATAHQDKVEILAESRIPNEHACWLTELE